MKKAVLLQKTFSFYLTFSIPLLYVVNIFVAFVDAHSFFSPVSLSILGIVITIAGILGWITSYVNLGRSFGVLPQKQKYTNCGLYRYTKHPMYISIWLTFLGLSLANNSWQGLVFLNLIIVPVLFIRAGLEEKTAK